MSRALCRGALALVTIGSGAAAQSDTSTTDSTRKATPLAAVIVTATRTPRSTFDTPQPVVVIDSAQLNARLPHGIADAFRDIPGLDASGVGPNQRRPEIRGQRGQRILLLQDGLRLNNARRQQDFGELPALAGLSSVASVEVVKGPSSVLYGTDAIGGVVNIVSAGLPRSYSAGEIHGSVSYRHGSAGKASMPDAVITTKLGRFSLGAGFSYRDAEEYSAPKGTFGGLTLDEDVLVRDSGVRDRSLRATLGYEVSATSELFARAESYIARDAGFGFVDPSRLGPDQPTIQILYPDQDYTRYTMGYRAKALSSAFANRVDVAAYVQRNERHLDMNIFVPITPTANVTTESFNFTDLATVGGRVELAKAFGRGHVLTYGADMFRDRSLNTDSSMTVVSGFGPPMVRSSNTPTVPNAVFQSAGIFGQLELEPTSRFTAVLGARAQDISAETRPTEGITAPPVESNDRTVVWTANALYRLAQGLNLVTSVGRGFRAANLVERFFEGSAPEGNGFQRANPSLAAERSINADVGLRYAGGPWFAESFVFRNDISDAIKSVATGDSVNGRPEFQNRNLGRLRVDGLELAGGARTVYGVEATASFTRLIGRNISDPGSPIGDSYSSKLVGDVAYHRPNGSFSVGYTVRHQGEQRDVIVGTNPIGDAIPAFTVHSARGSVRLFERAGISNRLSFSVDNLGNALYAEFPNASFFRPEPGRSVSVAIVTGF